MGVRSRPRASHYANPSLPLKTLEKIQLKTKSSLTVFREVLEEKVVYFKET